MKPNRSAIFFSSILILASFQCNKASNPAVKLKFQELSQIKKRLSGEWQMHYALGGFTGRNLIMYSQSFVTFGSNDSIKIILEGETWVNDKIVWVKESDIYNEQTYIITFMTVQDAPNSWIADDIQKDTLSIRANAYDGYAYFLTKKR